MKKIITTLAAGALILLAAFTVFATNQTAVESAVKNENRPADQVALDGARKPVEVLSFYGIEPGMRVLDVYSSGGYYTIILSNLVGEGGSVIAHNSERGWGNLEPTLGALYEGLGNVEVMIGDPADLELEDNSLDAIMLVLIYHHLFQSEEDGDALPAADRAIFEKFYRVLKHGGILAVVEHTAAPGSSRADAASWHRVPEATAIADFTSVGFTFEGNAQIHVNPDDDLQNFWRDAGLSRKTTRMVHKYRKPAE